jgi:hypothetical protein
MPAQDEISLIVERLERSGAAYMITGATAAILYGQPRVTNDLDLVLDLRESHVEALIAAFPPSEFYLPPDTVIRVEMARSMRGHFNVIHHESGFKADVYLAGTDPFHEWAFARRRRVEWTDSISLVVAPPEYVVVRKLEFFREGGSTKHLNDIRTILQSTNVSTTEVQAWVDRLGLGADWQRVQASTR